MKPPKFTVQQLAEVTIYYYQSGSYKEAQKMYQYNNKLPNLDQVPPRTIIRRCKDNFKLYGTVEKRTNTEVDRKRARTVENIQRVKEEIEREPKTSMRVLSTKLGIKQGTVHRILIDDLKRRPYKSNRANQNERMWMPAPTKNKGTLTSSKAANSVSEAKTTLNLDPKLNKEAAGMGRITVVVKQI